MSQIFKHFRTSKVKYNGRRHNDNKLCFNSSSGSVFGSNTNVFGGKATFGQANPTAASIFGGGGATTFGQKPTSSFWSGGNGNTEGGFGSSSGAFGNIHFTVLINTFHRLKGIP